YLNHAFAASKSFWTGSGYSSASLSLTVGIAQLPIYTCASAGGAPAPRRPAAHTTLSIRAPRPAGPQPRDGLQRTRPYLYVRLGPRGPRPATPCSAHDPRPQAAWISQRPGQPSVAPSARTVRARTRVFTARATSSG